MVINPNKSVVIFSHPRSGSSWFQESLPQFNLRELFNPSVEILHWDTEYIDYKYVKHNYEADLTKLLPERFDIFDSFVKHKKSVSVKTHTFAANKLILDFFKARDLDYLLIERKNKIDTFWSSLIAWKTMNFHDKAIEQEINVTREMFDLIIETMLIFEKDKTILATQFPIQKVYYEDLIRLPESDVWKPNNKFKVQNAKSVTKIPNLEEVNFWLSNSELIKLQA